MTAESQEASPARPSRGELWSAEAALMVRPFVTYRALAAEAEQRGARDLLRGVLLESVFVGAFVSLTSAGRLVAGHLLFTALFWGFLPLLQVAGIAAAVRIAAPRQRLLPALSLYFEGLGPWYVFFLVLSAVCLFVPDVYAAMTALMRVGAIPLLLLGTIVWGVIVTCAFFRAGLSLSRARAGLGAAVFYSIFVGVVLGWYLALNQIQPQVGGTRP